jgi:hypothetical protein
MARASLKRERHDARPFIRSSVYLSQLGLHLDVRLE